MTEMRHREPKKQAEEIAKEWMKYRKVPSQQRPQRLQRSYFSTFFPKLLNKEQTCTFMYELQPAVLTGYRPTLGLMECLFSMFYLHNQTASMWLCCALIALDVSSTIYFTSLDAEMPHDVLAVFWLSCTLRAMSWGNSWIYHTFICHADDDIAMIIMKLKTFTYYLSAIGMGTNIIYIELTCNPFQEVILWAGFLISITVMLCSVMPFYYSESYKLVVSGLNVLCLLPYIAGLAIALIQIHSVLPYYYVHLLLAFLFAVTAEVFVLTQAPEAIFPRRFDFLSSQCWYYFCCLGVDAYIMVFCFSAYEDVQNSQRCP